MLYNSRLFEERDRDGDKVISFSELKEFLEEIKFRKLLSDKENTTAEIMKDFDTDGDDKITMDEFVNGMTKWLDLTKDAMNKRYHSVKSLKDLYQPFGRGYDSRVQTSQLSKGWLFKEIDLDKDDTISYFELKELMTNMKFGIIPYDVDEAASKIMEELDISGDQLIQEEEFVNGLSKWINTTYNQNHNSEENEEDDNYQKTWEQTDKLVEDKFIDRSALAWIKAVSLLVLGIFMLGILAEPLVHSVREFSAAANVSSFYIAFIFVPLATNARLAVSALSEARRKKLHTTSLIMSEIYGTVFMNNVLGLAVLLSLIYFRDLSWNFGAEVLMVSVVSAVVGCLGSFSTVFSVWTSVFAYLLYPLSLVLVYVIGDFNWLY
ncbi:hypothetical protein RD792_006726 [Penstemon davidsonii]|uniref:EF-hand domain-containing protein n=1 Tax=Penstemon davidsonii TaxID=160366 RepID=A0ABR0DD57_9LAMI|nr:hypothetical protein RD792_006726 [Penstemon davidsonii]